MSMKLMMALLLLCTLFCLNIEAADGSGRTLRGAVITPDGTMVPEFTVIVMPVTNKPQLIHRKRFKDGVFTLEGLDRDMYQLQIVSPTYIGVKIDVNFAIDEHTDYRVVILHKIWNEPRFVPGSGTYTVSVKTLEQKIPDAAKEAHAKGVEHHRNGDLEQALMEYGQALRLCPDYVSVLSDIGTIYILLNRPDAALTFLHRAQQIDEANVIVRLNTAIALMAKREYDDALKVLQSVLRAGGRKSLPLYYTAKTYYDQKKYSLAEQTVRSALADDPELLDGWLLLANIGQDVSNRDIAREGLIHLREAMKNGRFSHFVEEQLLAMGSD